MANDEDLARIKEGVDVWNAWREQNREHVVDLSGARLGGVNLEGVNLSGANLRRAHLYDANLSRANLNEANLHRANLIDANLSKANLVRANLSAAILLKANLTGVDLEGADVRGANLERVILRGVNLSAAILLKANLTGVDLERTDLRGVNLSGVNLEGVNLEGVNLSGANLKGANLRGVNLEGADLGGVSLSGANLQEANLKLANLRGVDLSGARLYKADLAGADLRGVDLKSADFSPPIFVGYAGDVLGRETLGRAPSPTHFTVYHPIEIKSQIWCTLLVYVHIPEMRSMVEADAKQRLEVPHGRRIGKATRDIARGAEIVVIPELPGCRFNPPSARLLWLEDWQRVEFRLQAQPDFVGFELGRAVNGRVAFYVESVLVGEISIWTCISDEADTAAADAPATTASGKPYEAIFVSYAHEDSAVVDRLGRAYKVLGMEFLRDIEALRSGQEWNPALLAMIERANIFQLYWSNAAKGSRYVKQEWHHALKQKRDHFIRPLYWQVPMPEPPRELAQLHFSYLELDN